MLSILATPIGNLDDLTPRALHALKNAELIACEDTRRTWQLLSHHAIPRPRMISYRQGNEEQVAEKILGAVRSDIHVALCSDGGYPGISDPGYRLIKRVTEEDLAMEVLPGASAVPLALLYSGLPSSSYTFKGFPPRKPGPLHRFFESAESTFKIIIQLISATTGIPTRILLGSERGELASSQDERNWLSYIASRQTNFAGPVILRPFIDRLIEYGALPKVEYEIHWPNLFKATNKEKAETHLQKAKATNEYLMGPAATYIDIRKVLEDELELPIAIDEEEELDENNEEVKKYWKHLNQKEE